MEYVPPLPAALGWREYPMETICECGARWGAHSGMKCPSLLGGYRTDRTFVPYALVPYALPPRDPESVPLPEPPPEPFVETPTGRDLVAEARAALAAGEDVAEWMRRV